MKIGILGHGSIGRRHMTNIVNLGHEAIIYDPVYSERPDFSPRTKVLSDSDALIIATPTSQHAADLSDCLLLNKPVFIEKPIADGYLHGEHESLIPDMIPIMVGYNLRMHQCVVKARQWLPKIGTPIWAQFICAQFNDKPEYLRDGVILNWSHEIDLALHLLGPASIKGSSVVGTEAHDSLADMILWQQTCQTTVHLDYLTKPEVRSFGIIGSEGRIGCDLAKGFISLQTSTGYQEFLRDVDFDQSYVDEMSAFIDLAQGKPNRGCTAEEALAVLQICLKVREDAGYT